MLHPIDPHIRALEIIVGTPYGRIPAVKEHNFNGACSDNAAAEYLPDTHTLILPNTELVSKEIWDGLTYHELLHGYQFLRRPEPHHQIRSARKRFDSQPASNKEIGEFLGMLALIEGFAEVYTEFALSSTYSRIPPEWTNALNIPPKKEAERLLGDMLLYIYNGSKVRFRELHDAVDQARFLGYHHVKEIHKNGGNVETILALLEKPYNIDNLYR